ncbi:hypothetical protein SAMN04515647_3692 [Cohaesibacter sp. ES.047]|uniref:hypothetical protein n=1 Tax=Cohaesibacter sp. ES.047 TaxID=1798205 RepID=UPI000BB6AB5A|nr:hypothetical protein [Cohaesibacter sp. ES.047]SNY93397.1 hypothetical protein SAMN04515647_3692 [Cohaesibacter sp. ES.047]
MSNDRINKVHVSLFKPGYSSTPLVGVIAPNQSENYYHRGLSLSEAIELRDKLSLAIKEIREGAKQ